MDVKLMMRTWLGLIVVLCLASAPGSAAQSASTGALSGTVTDPSGALIPNATVTATSLATGQARSATTSTEGAYTIGLLPPGAYRVKFEAKGFETVEIPSVTVTITQTGTLNRTLQVGTQAQQVTVESNVETIQTTDATVGRTIGGETITDLPLAARNYTNLLSLSAGADAAVTNAAVLGKNTQATSVNGSNVTQNNYQMDGASIVSYSGIGGVIEGGSRGAFGIPNPDTIQEFRIQTAQYDAGYGRNPGANVNVVTKSGTNDFHGTAFEYFRNTVLNSADWFAKRSGIGGNLDRLLDQNQYGGVLGGPVKKDKLFFFAAYQGTWQKNGLEPAGAITSFIPALPLGNRGTCPAGATALSQCDAAANSFIGLLGAMYAGRQGAVFPGVPIAANGSNINPTGLQILQLKVPNGAYYIPSPLPGGGTAAPGVSCGPVGPQGFPPGSSAGAAFCTSVAPAYFHEYQGMGNFDYLISSKQTLSGRFFYSRDPEVQQFYQGGDTVPGTLQEAEFTNLETTLSLTSVLTTSLVNEARASFQQNLVNANTNAPFLNSTNVGMTALNAAIGYNAIPRIIIGNLNFGTPVFGNTSNHVNQFQWADQLSWTHGKQTIRAGFEAAHNNWNWNFVKGLGAGLLVFVSPADFLLGLPGCAPGAFPVTCNPGIPGGTNGTPISDIIAEPNFATRYSSFSNGDFHFWNWSYSTFFQDDVKVTKRLTLNVGVRWEYFGYPSERDGKGTNINTQLAALAPVPQTAAPCPQSPLNPAPPTPCPGSSLIGFTVPSNYNTAVLGAIPVDVFRRHHTSMGEETAPFDNFVPRLGFAWQPLSTNKFVVRGGVGFFYDYIGGELYVHGVLQSVPYAETLGGAGPAISFASLQQPYATTAANWTPRFVTASGASSNIFQPLLPVSLPVPLTYLWNLNTQYEVLPSLVVELGYVGSHGIHQNNNVNNVFPANPALLQNAAITGAAPVVGNAALRTPLLGFSPQIQAYANDTNSKYNAMQLSARKNFSHGLSFQAVYTWSRALVGTWQGNSAIRGATANPTWSLNPVIEHYGLNNVYHPQRFTFNYVYELPFGQHEGVLGWLAKGWRVSGQTTIQDGAPISVLDNNLGSIFGFSGGTPLASAAQYRVGQSNATAATHGSIDSRVINGWINTAAFCPSTATGDPCQNAYAISDGSGFGNAGQGNLLGPPQHNWDISLSKITRVGGVRESATLEFRTEFFNAFNHPQFNNPNNTQPGSVNPDVSTPSTLAITGLSVNPRLIQFALKYAF